MSLVIELPMPRIRRDSMPIEMALALRRSVRSFVREPITIEDLSQLLWACYGVSDPVRGFLTCPSAGATFPLEIYAVIYPGSVLFGDTFLEPGSYRYDPHTHSIEMVKRGDLRYDLFRACVSQEWVREALLSVVIAAVFERTTSYYGERGYRYVYFEAGHAAQNLYLEATALGLGAVAIGAFYDDEVAEVVGVERRARPIYIVSIGRPRRPRSVSEEEIASYIRSRRGLAQRARR